MLYRPNPLFIDNGDNIETYLSINVMHSDVVVCRLSDSFDFNRRYCIFRRFPGATGPCFNLHYDQPILYFRDQVQFFMGGMPIPFPNSVPFGNQIGFRLLFALDAQFVVFRHVVCERNVLIFVHKIAKA